MDEETLTAEEEQEAPVPLVTPVNNILHSIFNNVEAYINNQQIHNFNRLYAHKSYISNKFTVAVFEYKGVLHCERCKYEDFLVEIMDAPLSGAFFTRRMKILTRSDNFKMYGKLRVDIFSTSELLSLHKKNRLGLIRARPNFFMFSDNPNVSLGIVDCSLYTRRFSWKDEHRKKRIDILSNTPYTPVEFNYLETLAKTFILPAGQNQFIQEKTFNNAPVLRVAFARNTNSVFTGTNTEYPFWCKHFDLRGIRGLRGVQPFVHFDAAENCILYVTSMKSVKFQVDISSIPIDNFNDHSVLVFDSTSMQDATENCNYPELVREPLKLELRFTFLLEHITELFDLGERMSSVAFEKFGVVG